MQNFFKALASENKNVEIPNECDYFGKLIGSWEIDYIDNSNLIPVRVPGILPIAIQEELSDKTTASETETLRFPCYNKNTK